MVEYRHTHINDIIDCMVIIVMEDEDIRILFFGDWFLFNSGQDGHFGISSGVMVVLFIILGKMVLWNKKWWELDLNRES